MKNFRKSGWALAALFFFVGASIWEGSAAVSIGGELPERGYYAATNSFPRNTIVDITNLETGKSVRVIVAAGLDTPGLLAVLSRDAAADIGLQNRSISRIRMTQPTDPIAFSRFTEGFGSSGDPDYDPQASVNANTNPLFSESYTPPAVGDDTGTAPLNPEDAWAFQEPDGSEGIPPAYPPENRGSGLTISDEPIDTPLVYPPENGEGALTILDEPESLFPPGPVLEQYPSTGGPYDLSLVPSEARPPEEYRGLPPESEIPPLGSAPAAPPDRELTTAPFPPAPPASSRGANAPPVDPVFSVPLIAGLERGKYYLQLGAFSKAEAIEPELTRIGRTYPLAIQNGGTAERPIYRILLGPVNLGESGALLERFKRTGYTDAFVRNGGM
jgi:cell division septation protein DedD